MNTRTLLALCLLAASSAAALPLEGCGHVGTHGKQAEIEGREFLLQSAEGAPLLSGVRMRLGFSEAQLSAQATCNHLFGGYTLEDTRLVVGGLGQTEMGCEPVDHQRDEWLAAFLTSKPSLELSGSTLVLRSDGARLVLVDRVVADPDRPLRRTAWQVDTYLDGESAMGLLETQAPELVFGDDGRWRLRATCADGHGTYTADDDHLTLSDTRFADSQAPCTAENDRTAAEHLRAVMRDGKLRYRIEASALTIEGDARGLVLHDAK